MGIEKGTDRTASSSVSGTVYGSAVQASNIAGGVHIHAANSVPAAPIPRQVPAAGTALAGRERELAELDELLAERDGRLLVVVTGVGGVGKTALVTRWLDRVGPGLPDGQLYADLGGFSPTGTVPPSEVLGRFLRALGVPPDQVPVELSEQVSLYLSLTADRALAVFLDNAASAAHVRPLLPASPASVVAVTSRWRLDGLGMDGARFMTVSPLEPAGSLRLLVEALGEPRVAAERAPAEDLIRLCGGLPIALRITTARLSANPRRSLGKAVGDLHDEQRRLSLLSLPEETSVQAVFDLSYRQLAAEQARLYRWMAWHPGAEFGADVAAAAVEAPVGEVEDLLDDVGGSNLIEEIGERRFRYHDLLLLHARQHANRADPGSEEDAVVLRMVRWYLTAAITADLRVLPLRWRLGPGYLRPDEDSSFDSMDDALSWLEVERANLLAAMRYADDHHWDELTWQLCEAMWGLFLYHKHHRDWITTHELAVAAAHRCGNRLAEVRMRCQLGFGYRELSRFAETIEVCEIALELAMAEDDPRSIANALEELGAATRGRGDPAAAVEYFRQALVFDERAGRVRGIALRRRRIGEALTDLGRYDEAVEELLAARELMARLCDRMGEGRTLTFLGIAYARAHRSAEAQSALAESLAIMRDSGSPFYHAEVLAALGELAETTGDLPAAVDWLTQACQYYEQAGGPHADRARALLTEATSRVVKRERS